uniref:SIT4-associating protein/190 n=1 Tax=Kwoniella pini CBS 10737 TaxID=1296096 RepID=A0A1B9I4C3_9TREE|nr:uncharacterized protein I206_03680 [Kwoniella pini CBS 10737]OCF50359.1 hypothetical protein I206_03680 [Kwoniella pini CBS 10737]
MLWRFSFASNSTLDALLTRDIPPSIEEILDEQEILNECKAQNNKLMSYLSKEESVKSLLTWVVAGLDELNQQAKEADDQLMNKALTSTDFYPSYKPSFQSLSIPGNGPNSPPLEPSLSLGPPSNLVSVDLSEDKQDQIADMAQHNKAEVYNGLGDDDDQFIGSDVGLGKGLRRKSEAEEDVQRTRYPTLATEILCCAELWSMSETIIHHSDYLLAPFWDAVLPPLDVDDPKAEPIVAPSTTTSRQRAGEKERARNEFWSDKDEERDKKREVIRGMWVRVNQALLAKRAPEMIRFIQSIPNLVERVVARIASPAIQDILIKIISAEEGGGNGVIEWLADQGLISRLLEFLSPHYQTSLHTTVADILKSIIHYCTPTPFNPQGGNTMEQQAGQGQNTGSRDNRLIRDLMSESNVKMIIGFMLDDLALTDKDWKGVNAESEESEETAEFTSSPLDPFIVHPLPSIASATSSLTNICSVLVEVIRRNNSDFSEPHLFHTLRNRLMSVRMQPNGNGNGNHDVEMETEQEKEEKDRRNMEEALADMSSKMGIVHLGHLLDLISQKFDKLHQFVKSPRSQDRAASAAQPKPLTLERFRILELYAELLHSSNMSILNRTPGTGPTYTEEGILSGGLEGLEALGEAIDGDQAGEDDTQNEEDQVTQARELPVSCGSTDASLTESEDDVTSDDEEMLENIDVDDVNDITPSNSPSASKVLNLPSSNDSSTPTSTLNVDVPPPPSPADVERLRDVMGIESKPTSLSVISELGGGSNIAIANSSTAPSIESSLDIDVTEQESDAMANLPEPTIALSTANSTSKPIPPPIKIVEDISKFAPGDKLKKQYINNSVIPDVIRLFFDYPNNDFMHHVVYDILQQILNGRLGPGLNSELVVELIVKAELVERVLDAQRLNDRLTAQPRTPRLAYMGHITLISEELVKFFARCPPDLYERIKDSFIPSEWEAFVGSSLKEAKARDSKPLAGGKPMSNNTNGSIDDESSSDEEDDQDREQVVKFGEPLTRTSAGDGFINRGGGNDEFDQFDEDDHADEEGMDRFWRNSGVGLDRRPTDSSDDDDDADWLQPTSHSGWANNASNDDDDFGAWETAGPSRQNGTDDFDDGDGWGNFTSGSPSFASPNPVHDPDAKDPFADDNDAFDDNFEAKFTPSVIRAEPPSQQAQSQAHVNQVSEIPLTPRDWAEQFDRAFREGGDPATANPDEHGVTAIVVPEDDEDEDEDDIAESGGRRMSMSAGTNSWTFEGDDEGVDLPPTESPTIPQIPGFENQDPTTSFPAPPSRSENTMPKEAVSSPQPVSPRRQTGAAAQFQTTSSAPIPLNSSISNHPSLTTSPTSSPLAKPINIPQRKLSRGHAAHPGHPSGSGSFDSNSSTTTSASISSSASFEKAFSPPDPSLVAAASEDSPLGPGVSPDTKINHGLLEREVDGKMVRVPQDEIVEAIERAQDDLVIDDD